MPQPRPNVVVHVMPAVSGPGECPSWVCDECGYACYYARPGELVITDMGNYIGAVKHMGQVGEQEPYAFMDVSAQFAARYEPLELDAALWESAFSTKEEDYAAD